MPAVRVLVIVLALVVFPSSAAARALDAGPNSDYDLTALAVLTPSSTDLELAVTSSTAPVPTHFEKVQVKIWPVGDGDVKTSNLFDVAAPGGVATVQLDRLQRLQRVEARVLVKNGSQNVLTGESLVQYRARGAVSTDHPLATKAAQEVLAGGGNAFDAAAAALFVLNVTQPHLAGIGGSSNIVAYNAKDGRVYAIDGRETAPANTTPGMYNGPQTITTNSLQGYTVGVPGTLRAVERMLDEWGTMTLADALQPAIRIAAEGFDVGAFLAKDAADARVKLFPPDSQAMLLPNGVPLKKGDRLTQPELAETFRLIAEKGTRVFYDGVIADAIVAAQKWHTIPQGEGRMLRDDLASYDVAVRAASHLDYRGYDVFAAAPSGSTGGLVLLETLGLLEDPRFAMGDVAAGYGFGTRYTIHAMVEALRLAFADRDALLTDPSFFPMPWPAVPEADLLGDAYLRDRSLRMNPFPSRMPPVVPAGKPSDFPAPEPMEGDSSHTTHFSVIDSFGNAVSFTTTMADSFGTGIKVPGFGFFLNDSLRLFNVNLPIRGGANDAGPGKRPMGSMTPTLILKDGEPFAVTGTYGNLFIPSLVLNVVLDLIDHRLPLQAAVDASRIWMSASTGGFAWNYPLRPAAPTIDQFCPPPPNNACVGEIEELRKIGHIAARRPQVQLGEPTFGSLASVGVDPATYALVAASDDARQADATAAVVPR